MTRWKKRRWKDFLVKKARWKCMVLQNKSTGKDILQKQLYENNALLQTKRWDVNSANFWWAWPGSKSDLMGLTRDECVYVCVDLFTIVNSATVRLLTEEVLHGENPRICSVFFTKMQLQRLYFLKHSTLASFFLKRSDFRVFFLVKNPLQCFF